MVRRARLQGHDGVRASRQLEAQIAARVAAFGILCVMVVAVLTTHTPHGFFMNWYGNQKGEGFEFHLLAIGIALALILGGAGLWSVDALLAR